MIPCPVCGNPLDEAKHKIAEKLGQYGYFHKDVWLRCPVCGYKPVFGRELGETDPVYFYPPYSSRKGKERKKLVIEALRKLVKPPISVCICGSDMELHKVWINTFRHDPIFGAPLPLSPDDMDVSRQENRERFFMTKKGKEGYCWKLIESGILAQLKCKEPQCKYVRYITL